MTAQEYINAIREAHDVGDTDEVIRLWEEAINPRLPFDADRKALIIAVHRAVGDIVTVVALQMGEAKDNE